MSEQFGKTLYFPKESGSIDLWYQFLTRACGQRDIKLHYEFGVVLGSGSFGKVVKAQKKNVNLFEGLDSMESVAIKCMSKRDFSREDYLLQLNEIEFLRVIQNIAPQSLNIVKLLDVFEDENSLFIVMEFV